MIGLSFIKSNLSSLRYKSIHSLTLYKKNHPHGFMYNWLGTDLAVMAVDPESAKFVLKSPDFQKFNGLTLSPKYLDDVLGVNLVSVNGDVWKRHRSYVNSGFTHTAYQEYFPIFLNMINKSMEKLEEKAKENRGDVDVRSMMSKFTLDLLGNSVFHYDFGLMDGKLTEIYSHYSSLMDRFSTTIGKLMIVFPWLEVLPLPQISRLCSSVDQLKEFFLQIIKQRQVGEKHHDILDNLLSSTQNKESGLSEVELLSNIFVLFVAGHETTATALTWACVNLARHQEIQDKIYHEIQETIGNQVPTFDDLSKLHYLDCFISEVLRVNSPAPFLPTRLAVRDVVYNEQFIPKGSIVGVFISAVHQNPNFWPNPEKFDPDRFLPENKKGRDHYSYLPFSLGPRQCIGNNFSLIEQRLFITRLLQKFRVLPPKNGVLRGQDQMLEFGKLENVTVQLEQR